MTTKNSKSSFNLCVQAVCIFAGCLLSPTVHGAAFNLASTVSTNAPIGLATMDVNGDGKPDLISADMGLDLQGHTLNVSTNDGSGVFTFDTSYSLGPAGSSTIVVITVDVNGDGKQDLAAANFNCQLPFRPTPL